MATARIASVHYASFTAHRNYRGHPYEIGAVPLGADPTIIECHDLVQRDEGPVSSGPGGGKRQKVQYAVMGEEIAACVVRECTETGLGMNPACRPGIWVVRDRIPVMKIDPVTQTEIAELDVFGKQVFRTASQEEIQKMWKEDLAAAQKADRAYAEWCYVEGNSLASDPRRIPLIPYRHKLAVRHYGLEAAWAKEGAGMEMVSCKHCGTIIFKHAMVCRQCTLPVDLEKWAVFSAQKDTALREEKARVMALAEPVETKKKVA